MKRSRLGKHRASRRKLRKRQMAVEALEPKRVLDASFGFHDVAGGFVFAIEGTDFHHDQGDPKVAEPDNIVLWSDLGFGTGGNAATNFFVEWVDTDSTWHSMSGSVTAGDIADEAQDRGLQPGDFKGFVVKAMGGEDTISLNGAESGDNAVLTEVKPLGFSAIMIRSGAPLAPQTIFAPLIGSRVNASGNGGGDFIFGSPEDDFIDGGADKDLIVGGAGNDTISGGTGEDQIDGGSGKDTLDGNEDRDLILGGPGDDIIRGGDGDDGRWTHENKGEKFGEDEWADGSDTPFKDVPFGLYGQAGGDTVEGGAGNDDITGDAGGDDLSGGEGHDSLLGDNDDKTPKGGKGTDVWQAGPTTDGGVEFAAPDIEKVDTTGNDGNEPTWRMGDYKPDNSIDRKYTVIRPDKSGPFGSISDAVGSSYAGVGGTTFGYKDEIDLSGWTDNDTSGVVIITGNGDDILVGSDAGKDILQAGPDDDILIGRGQNDYLGGDANALKAPDSEPVTDVFLSDRNYQASHQGKGTSPGGSYRTDPAGDDSYDGPYDNGGNDLISGGAGSDMIDGFADGGTGMFTGTQKDNNVLVEWYGDTLTFHKMAVNVDDNPVVADGSNEGVQVSLEAFLDFWNAGDRRPDKVGDSGADYGQDGHAEGDLILNEAGSLNGNNKKTRDPSLPIGGSSGDHKRGPVDSSIENVIGSDFADEIYLDVTDNGGHGKPGDDVYRGLEGNDVISGGEGDDLIDGDYIPGEVNKWVAITDFGDDNLLGGKGNDELLGRKGMDQLRGEIGDDVVDGGEGIDALSGGKGQDTVRTEYDPGSSDLFNLVDLNFSGTFFGFLFGNEGNDRFEVSGAPTANDQFDVMSELAIAETDGISDFENNEDDLDFV